MILNPKANVAAETIPNICIRFCEHDVPLIYRGFTHHEFSFNNADHKIMKHSE
tara:strand:+ start:4160 stop:4318 length:159 start_codon:yes stop_codon:yes gene_type:complete